MDTIREMAAVVGAEHSAYAAAKADKAQQEDDLLRELLTLVIPALPAVCSTETAGKSRIRAVRLPAGLFLGEGGMFFDANGKPLTVDEVLSEVSVVDILVVLSGLLSAQAGKRTNITETIRREARTIEAVLIALKAGGIK